MTTDKGKATWWFSVVGGVYGFGPIDLGRIVSKKQATKEILARFNLRKKELAEIWPGKY